MRTALSIDDDVLSLAKLLADSRRISVGQAISYLARRGASTGVVLREKDGFPVFPVDSGTPQFSQKDIDAALDAEDQDWGIQFLKTGNQ